MPKIFTTLDKIKPAYDVTYKVVLFICKILLIVDILITTMSVIGRYVPFIPDPAWSEEVVLTCMSYMAVLSAALAIRRGAHIRMTAFDVYLPKIAVKVLDILADLAVCILGLIMLVVGWNYATTLGGRGNEAGQSCTRSGTVRRRYPPYILVFPTDNARSGFPVPLPESILSQKSPPLHIFPCRNQAVIVFRRQCADMTDTEHRVGKRAAVRADPDAVFILQNLKNPMR